MNILIKTQKCIKCGEEKELSEFYKDKRASSGHLGTCISCAKHIAINRHYNRDSIPNREAIKEGLKKYDRVILKDGRLRVEDMIITPPDYNGYTEISIGINYIYINKRHLSIISEFIKEQLK